MAKKKKLKKRIRGLEQMIEQLQRDVEYWKSLPRGGTIYVMPGERIADAIGENERIIEETTIEFTRNANENTARMFAPVREIKHN